MKMTPIPGWSVARRRTRGAGTESMSFTRNDNTTKTPHIVSSIPDAPTPSFTSTPTLTFSQVLVSDFQSPQFLRVSIPTYIVAVGCNAPSRYSAAGRGGDTGPYWPTRRRAAPPSCTSTVAQRTRGASYRGADVRSLVNSSMYQDPPLVSTTAAKHTFRHVLLIEEECIRCKFTFPSI
jgi:hypothetical protein